MWVAVLGLLSKNISFQLCLSRGTGSYMMDRQDLGGYPRLHAYSEGTREPSFPPAPEKREEPQRTE